MKDIAIDIRSLSKEFGKESGRNCKALNKVTFSIPSRAIFGIIGSSGAGKSTLMRCLVGLEKPCEGEIIFEKSNDFGMIFQHFNLFSAKTALENITFPLEIRGVSKKNSEESGIKLLKLVGLEDKGNVYPAHLSGGEKQRVAIARALVNNPSLLFSDEGTSALDPTTKASILSLLLHLNQTRGLTIVLITHEMDVITQICSHVAVLEKGVLVEQRFVGDRP